MRFNSEVNTLDEIFNNYLPEPNTGCWLWLGGLDTNEYPITYFHNCQHYVHRLMYKTLVRNIPRTIHLHHRCRTPICINYEHLIETTLPDHNRIHGKDIRSRRKVTKDMITSIKIEIKTGNSKERIGALFGISATTVSKVLNGFYD